MATTIVLDPGHGGHDFGATNGPRQEKNDNLRMALAVGNLLRSCGFNVVFTRTTDVFIPLIERANISNRANADLFISFHRNGFPDPRANGFENWIHTTASPRSLEAATNILNNVVAVGVQNNRGIKRGDFVVLRETRAPAVLIESGFISNDEDNRLFDTRFDAYAQAIANGIARTFNRTCVATTPPQCPTCPTPPIAPVPPPSTDDQRRTIQAIQQRLNSYYGQNLAVDGIWGPLSNRAMIRAYQTELNRDFGAGLVVDGIWGPRTRAATRIVRQGDRNNRVWILQAMMFVRGFRTNPDGIFGPLTDATVRNYQRTNGLIADGLAGPMTFSHLFTGSI